MCVLASKDFTGYGQVILQSSLCVGLRLVGLSLSLSRPALAQLTFAPKVDNQPGDFNIDNSGPTKVSGG